MLQNKGFCPRKSCLKSAWILQKLNMSAWCNTCIRERRAGLTGAEFGTKLGEIRNKAELFNSNGRLKQH